jgi:hypothetical protein
MTKKTILGLICLLVRVKEKNRSILLKVLKV